MREFDTVPNLSSVLLQVARLVATSDPAQSARLAGAAMAFAERAGIRFPLRYSRAAERLYEDLQRRLGATPAQNAWIEGGQLSTLEAVDIGVTAAGANRRLARDISD
jgi:hypothetical protein